MTHEELVDLVAKQIVLLATDGYNSREMAAAVVPLVVEACAEEVAAAPHVEPATVVPSYARMSNMALAAAADHLRRKLGGTP